MKILHLIYLSAIFYLVFLLFQKEGQLQEIQTTLQNIEAKVISIEENNETENTCHIPMITADNGRNLYIGFGNHITASITGIPNERIKVSARGGEVSHYSDDNYTIEVNNPGVVYIHIEGEGENGQIIRDSVRFRTKHYPDPTPYLGRSGGDNIMGAGEFRAQRGIRAPLLNMDINFRYPVIGFDFTRVRPNEPFIMHHNEGATFSSKILDFVKQAKSGDIYIFDNIEVKSPPQGRTIKLASRAYKVK